MPRDSVHWSSDCRQLPSRLDLCSSKKLNGDTVYSREGVIVEMATSTVVTTPTTDGNVKTLVHRVESVMCDRQVMESIESDPSSALSILILRVAGLSNILEGIVRNIGIIQSSCNKDSRCR